jgi:TRAP-type C4-dicarboxylate transport system permease small subunit
MRSFWKAYEWLVMAMAVAAGLIVAATFVAVIYDAMLRNLGFHPTRWILPASEYGLLYVTLLSAPWLLRVKRIIMVESLRRYMPPGMRRALEIAIYLLCAAVCVVIVWFAADQAIDSYERGDVEQRGIAMPFYLAYVPFVLSFALMGIEFLRLLATGESIYPVLGERETDEPLP